MLKIFRSRPAGLTLVYTGDPVPRGPVVFLAGPTARTGRTEWRLRAVEEIRTLGYQGAVVVPEFASGDFDGEARARGWVGDSPVSGLARRGYEVVSWETEGIRAAEARGALLFWMPFTAPETGPDGLPARSSMPGMTTS
jgi:hypothetical protein